MTVLYSFLAGVTITMVVAYLIMKNVVAKRDAQSLVNQTQAKVELDHANQRVQELQSELNQSKIDAKKLLEETKNELRKDYDEKLQSRDNVHREAMVAMKDGFNESLDKMSAQVKSETMKMLQDRQKEFAVSSQDSLSQILDPLRENVTELKKAIADNSKEQASRDGEMREQIRSMMSQSEAARKSADELAAAFKHGSKIQGDWGETILDELLSSQGLCRGIHYDVQETMRDAKGKVIYNEAGEMMRPDVIIHLDDKREVIVDSKVSLTSYVDYVNAENEDDRKRFLKAHIESIKKHVKELADKDYSSYIQSPKVSLGYVIMFVPNISALWTALNAEPDLWRKAAESNVFIVDEQSLYGTLKMVSMTWTQIKQNENHEKVYALANEMIERVGLFMQRFEELGTTIGKVQEAYNGCTIKLLPNGQSIINTSKKLIDLGAKNSTKHPIKALNDIDSISEVVDSIDVDMTGGVAPVYLKYLNTLNT